MRLDQVDIKKPKQYMTNPYPIGFKQVDVPEGKSGKWSVQKYVLEEDA